VSNPTTWSQARRPLAILALAIGLAGCPLPQPLPDYPAGTVTPPRILVDELLEDGSVTLVPASCTAVQPTYLLNARINDPNTIESIEARWFVNYDFRGTAWSRIWDSKTIQPNQDTTNLIRVVPTFTFSPYDAPPPFGTPPLAGPPYSESDVVRVVEVVVSNGFDPALVGTIAPGANRAPIQGFETQFHRWVFLTVPPSSSVPCPP
jgi:hypothetical protein